MATAQPHFHATGDVRALLIAADEVRFDLMVRMHDLDLHVNAAI